VLKPGGRIMVSDIVLTRELPEVIKNDMAAYASCISGAIIKDAYLKTVEDAGFTEIKVVDETSFPLNYIISDDSAGIIKDYLNKIGESADSLIDTVLSIKVSAVKR